MEAVFSYLTGKRISEACSLAQQSGRTYSPLHFCLLPIHCLYPLIVGLPFSSNLNIKYKLPSKISGFSKIGRDCAFWFSFYNFKSQILIKVILILYATHAFAVKVENADKHRAVNQNHLNPLLLFTANISMCSLYLKCLLCNIYKIYTNMCIQSNTCMYYFKRQCPAFYIYILLFFSCNMLQMLYRHYSRILLNILSYIKCAMLADFF